MKRLIALVLALSCLFALAGCAGSGLTHTMDNAPTITGVVKDTKEHSILIENENGEYWVSLNVASQDRMPDFSAGDEVVVYYDGTIAESYPMQITMVYAIQLKTPAGRAENAPS